MNQLTPGQQATLLLTKLPALEAELEVGAIVTFARGRTPVRRLPLAD